MVNWVWLFGSTMIHRDPLGLPLQRTRTLHDQQVNQMQDIN